MINSTAIAMAIPKRNAMRIAGRLPDGAGWLRSIELVLLALAAVLFVAGIVCIVAFNWA